MSNRLSLIVDAGNTCTKLCVARNGNPLHTHIAAKGACHTLVNALGSLSEQIDTGIISSVGTLPVELVRLIRHHINTEPVVLNAETPLPISVRYNRSTLGSDRLAAAVGAFSLATERVDLLIVDVGTCITIDRVGADGCFLGGNISPGIGLRFKAMHRGTKRLPLVHLPEDPIPDWGICTENAMRAGVMRGLRYEITGYIHDFQTKHPDGHVFLTGGSASYFESRMKNMTFVGDLVLKGLARILDYQYQYA